MEISSVNSANFTGSEDKKVSTGKLIGGAIVGNMVAGAVGGTSTAPSASLLQIMRKLSKSLSADEFSAIEKAAEKTLIDTGLKAKGIEILKASDQNMGKIKETLLTEINSGFIGKKIIQPAKELLASFYGWMFNQGFNAGFLPKTNKIILPEKHLTLSVFHEMGHAMNANFSKIGKFLQKSRALTLLAAPIGLIALFKNKKTNGEEPKGFLDKTTTFIKENAGKLTFLTFVPTLIEEAMASVKGQKLAKALLNPELVKKVAKTNIAGFATYLIGATLAGVGIYLGTKVRDKIVHKQTA